MRRVVIALILVLAVVGAFHALSPTGESSPLPAAELESDRLEMDEIKILKTTSSIDAEMVDWARDRYQEAGLSLPPIHVSFYRNTDPCEGARGGHVIEDGISRVLICISQLGSSRELKLKRTVLHEFAHAWDAHFLTQDVRRKFIEHHGLEAWSFEVTYEERGSEHAAETITWGLIDEPILFGSLETAPTWEDLYRGYVTLTGVEPPHGYVWSLFAASHDVYAHTPSQLEMVEQAWNQSDEIGRRSQWIEVRFHKTALRCGGELTSSKLVGNRLHIEACPGSDSGALLEELTGR